MSLELQEPGEDLLTICAAIPKTLQEQLKIYADRQNYDFGEAIRTLLVLGLEEDRRNRRSE